MAGRFTFGENWQEYVDEHLTEERVELAKESLVDFYSVEDFSGREFLDVGCGSGLFSYAAHELGAERIHSFDVDGDSVSAARKLRKEAGEPENWTVEQGDILDDGYAEELGEWDLVYSWGVLHHTGNMWEALDNTLDRVAPGGELYLALYSDGSSAGLTAEQWRSVKKLYNRLPWPLKRCMEAAYILGWSAMRIRRGRNPVRDIRGYAEESARGMAFYPDVKDWLGGLPYEFASVEEVKDWIDPKPEFTMARVEEGPRLQNNEYLIRRKGSG